MNKRRLIKNIHDVLNIENHFKKSFFKNAENIIARYIDLLKNEEYRKRLEINTKLTIYHQKNI